MDDAFHTLHLAEQFNVAQIPAVLIVSKPDRFETNKFHTAEDLDSAIKGVLGELRANGTLPNYQDLGNVVVAAHSHGAYAAWSVEHQLSIQGKIQDMLLFSAFYGSESADPGFAQKPSNRLVMVSEQSVSTSATLLRAKVRPLSAQWIEWCDGTDLPSKLDGALTKRGVVDAWVDTDHNGSTSYGDMMEKALRTAVFQ